MKRAIVILFLLAFHDAPLAAGTLAAQYVPEALRNVEGNAFDAIPFGSGPVRYQQVYAASEFSTLRMGGGWIDAMLLRVEANRANGGSPFYITLPDIQISLSTTPTGPDLLSAVFAENVGPDQLTVLGPRSLELDAPFFHETVPQPFVVTIRFDHPFYYDPARGNLLLDVRGGALADGATYDAVNVVGDGVSRVWGAPTATVGSGLDSLGLVTLFIVEPVPEPGAGVLLLVGLSVLFIWTAANRRAARQRH